MSARDSTFEKPFENETSSTIKATIARDVVTSRYICNICEFSYATKESLKIHKKPQSREKVQVWSMQLWGESKDNFSVTY